MSKPKPTNDYVQFRLIHMPCCHILICWVNPRRLMYCPECGTRIFNCFPRERWDTQFSEAWLRIMDNEKANYVCDIPAERDEEKIERDLRKIAANYHREDGNE